MTTLAWYVRQRERQQTGRARRGASERWIVGGVAAWMLGLLALFVLLPIASLLWHSVVDAQGQWAGFDSFVAYSQTPGLAATVVRSVWVAGASAVLCVALAAVYAYALTHTAMPFKRFFKAVALLPLLAPSLLMGISLVVLFGHQGLLKVVLGGASIYGAWGIVLGSVLWTFPHALLLLTSAMGTSDGRLYEAAQTLGASRWRQAATITWPSARYGVWMAVAVVFVLVITDFGVAKVVGGQANVLATDLYKKIIGQQNFQAGAVVGVLLLLPAVLAFVMDRHLRAKQHATRSVRATPHTPAGHAAHDSVLLVFCGVVAVCLIGTMAVAVWASLATYWPYDLRLTLKHYRFDTTDGGGWGAYWNSLRMALAVAVVGTVAAFLTAWSVAKARVAPPLRAGIHGLASLPMAVPGLVLGLGYIFYFNHPDHLLNGLYGTLMVLVACTVAHFFAVAHLGFLIALQQTDPAFDHAGEVLGVPSLVTAWRVHVPLSAPVALNVAGYFFVNAMTTVSAAVFLVAPGTQLASVAVLAMDDAGDTAPAAAMAVLIVLAAAVVRLLMALAAKRLQQHAKPAGWISKS
jgi:iron(III) transport system permease protein